MLLVTKLGYFCMVIIGRFFLYFERSPKGFLKQKRPITHFTKFHYVYLWVKRCHLHFEGQYFIIYYGFQVSLDLYCWGWDGLLVCFNKHMSLREVKKQAKMANCFKVVWCHLGILVWWKHHKFMFHVIVFFVWFCYDVM